MRGVRAVNIAVFAALAQLMAAVPRVPGYIRHTIRIAPKRNVRNKVSNFVVDKSGFLCIIIYQLNRIKTIEQEE
jgi:hypothetical protein